MRFDRVRAIVHYMVICPGVVQQIIRHCVVVVSHSLVHLYSARGLPPADENGVLDPYVTIEVEDQEDQKHQVRWAGWKLAET